jgi:tetratricopeptide (TPR) repeat protein
MVRLNVLDGNDSEIAKNRNQAIDLGEDNPKVYIVLADAYAHIKYYDTAMQFLNQAIENKLSGPDIYIMIGKVHLSKINGTEAIKNFEEALKLESGNPEALTQKAKVYSLINNTLVQFHYLKKQSQVTRLIHQLIMN